jgi:hypothetical protein
MKKIDLLIVDEVSSVSKTLRAELSIFCCIEAITDGPDRHKIRRLTQPVQLVNFENRCLINDGQSRQ